MGIGIAIPTYERQAMTCQAFAGVYDDSRVEEIVIADDASAEPWSLAYVARFPKVRLSINSQNLGCFLNKKRAVDLATTEWVVVFDSDNVMLPEYLDTIWDLRPWSVDTLYMPTFARPKLDYRLYEGLTCTRFNVADFINDPVFQMALNTGNFFVNRAAYLGVRQHDDLDPLAADSIYFVSQWLASGRQLLFVPGLAYDHLVHDGWWMRHAKASEALARTITQQLRRRPVVC